MKISSLRSFRAIRDSKLGKRLSKAVPSLRSAFTLIEILVVISIIAVLAGLLFPAMGAVRTSARKTSAKNDLVQLVNAVRNFYVDYGRYPIPSGSTGESFEGENAAPVIMALTGTNAAINPRGIRYLEVPVAKNKRSGLSGTSGNVYWYDPFGSKGGNKSANESEGYNLYIDANYDDKVTPNGYTEQNTGVAAFSKGPDGKSGSATERTDDVLSWQ